LKRIVIAVLLVVAGAALVACSAILGLQEPVVDDTINGDADKPDGVVPDDAGDGGPQQLVPSRVTHLALDDSFVYYTAEFDQLVGRVAKDGSSKLTLANGTNAAGFGPYEVALDTTDVFWTDAQSIFQCKKTGCNNSPTRVIDGDAVDAAGYEIEAYAVDDAQTLYFASYDNNLDQTTIYTVPKGVASAPVTMFLDPASLAFCPTLGELAYSAGQLYVLCEEGPIAAVDTTTKAIIQLTTSSAPPSANDMVVAGSTIYYTQFTDTGSIFSVATTANAGSVPVALDQANPEKVAIDQQYLYWTLGGSLGVDSAVVRCTLGSCSTTVTTLVGALDSAFDVKSDGVAVYYSVPGTSNTDSTAGIYKVVP
jgi:hypothetical protein